MDPPYRPLDWSNLVKACRTILKDALIEAWQRMHAMGTWCMSALQCLQLHESVMHVPQGFLPSV